MDTSTRAPGYDLFKLVVAIFLLLIFICLILWIPTNAPQTAIPTDTQLFLIETQPITTTIAPPIPSSTATSPSALLTLTSPPLASSSTTSTNESVTATTFPLPLSTETSASGAQTVTSLPLPSPTGTSTPISSTTTSVSIPTLTSTPTPHPTVIPSPTPTVEPPSNVDTCDAAMSRSQLQVGQNATILRRLNFRSSPGIQDNWIQTNLSGTQVEVIDGPVCLPHFIGAYVWWQIRLPDGQVGWSAEASLFGRFYFMEPVN